MTKRLNTMKPIAIVLSTALLFAFNSDAFGQRFREQRVPSHLTEKKLKVDALERTYYLFAPNNLPGGKKVPLLFVFHGGGGNAISMDRRLGFTQLARREKFLVIYPAGIGRNWNDGRKTTRTRAHRENINDVAFVEKMITDISKDFRVDEKRIYATGASNGGIFSHYVAAHLANRFAAIAPVIGGIADPFHKRFNPSEPVSVFVIQGTEDRLVPYDGNGSVGRNRGKIIGTDEAIRLWVRNNKTETEPVRGNLPDRAPNDGCRVETFLWRNGSNGSVVQLYKLNGAGHTWPGGIQYLPRIIVGRVCRDFRGADVIWRFFKHHPKR